MIIRYMKLLTIIIFTLMMGDLVFIGKLLSEIHNNDGCR